MPAWEEKVWDAARAWDVEGAWAAEVWGAEALVGEARDRALPCEIGLIKVPLSESQGERDSETGQHNANCKAGLINFAVPIFVEDGIL